jgi:hypothetical protein
MLISLETVKYKNVYYQHTILVPMCLTEPLTGIEEGNRQVTTIYQNNYFKQYVEQTILNPHFFNFTWSKEEFPQENERLITLSNYRRDAKSECTLF